MTKVCHITSVHKSNDVRILLKECFTLANAGYDVSFIVPNCKDEIRNNVKIINVKSNVQTKLGRMIKTVWRVYKKALMVNADIYHCHDPELLRIALKLKRKGKKVIYDVHEDVPRQILEKYYLRKPFRKIIATLFEMFENFAVSKLDFIITATPFIRNRFLKINNSTIDINNFPLLHEITEITDWGNKNNEVCYVGGLTKIRGITEIVKAMEHVNNVKLNLAGVYAPGSYHEELMQLDGWNKINECGLVNRKRITEIMGKSIAGIVTFLPIPNHTDSQPNKMFEYMSAGIPVIASNFPLWREIIEGNDCGICVDPLNPKEIADAINYLIQHDEIAKKMGENGRKAVEKKYNWSIEEEKLIKVYQKMG